jgi:hypothetical protein
VVAQVHVVAILMIVHGTLVSLMGAFYTMQGPAICVSFWAPNSGIFAPSGQRAFDLINILYPIYAVIGLPVLAVGILNIVAGIRCLRLRGRVLAIVALCSNIFPVFTCYCLPTSIGLMIYGLIVLFHSEVAFAFAAVAARAAVERLKSYRRSSEEGDFENEPLPPLPKPRQGDNIQSHPGERYHRPPHEE